MGQFAWTNFCTHLEISYFSRLSVQARYSRVYTWALSYRFTSNTSFRREVACSLLIACNLIDHRDKAGFRKAVNKIRAATKALIGQWRCKPFSKNITANFSRRKSKFTFADFPQKHECGYLWLRENLPTVRYFIKSRELLSNDECARDLFESYFSQSKKPTDEFQWTTRIIKFCQKHQKCSSTS